ncbi:AEX-3 domain-domain-containing protein [Naematelia encephala]|uniref:AEX-3 domain-domain-containing protein n=1 Tax=Naematelia encephala TaxID=71784 RepID=A0A1Y2AFB9_9TREE|nr:AEX-3 domain-domain-containing protein [Naematelia encephala]
MLANISFGSLGRSHSHSRTQNKDKGRPKHFPSPPSLSPRFISSSSGFEPDQVTTRIHDAFARASEGQAGDIYNLYNPPRQRLPSIREQPAVSLDRRIIESVKGKDKDVKARAHPYQRQASREDQQPETLSSLLPPSRFTGNISRSSSITSFADRSQDYLPNMQSPFHFQTPYPNPISPSESGYDTHASGPSTLPRRTLRNNVRQGPSPLNETPEHSEEHDRVHSLRLSRNGGVLDSLGTGYNSSSVSVGSRPKTDKVLGIDSHARIASFYLVSGLPRDGSAWSFADTDATRGLQPTEDSIGLFWRPDMLGSAFSGHKTEDFLREVARRRKDSKASGLTTFTSPLVRSIKGVHVPDAGPDGAMKLVTKTMKYAHPRDVEIVNSTLAPPTTCHAFTFTIPRHDTLAAVARSRLDSATASLPAVESYRYDSMVSNGDESSVAPPLGVSAGVRNMTTATDLMYHGVTLTVWTHADHDRAQILKELKLRVERGKNGLDTLTSNPLVMPQGTTAESRRRSSMPWGKQNDATETDGETETGMSDADFDGPMGSKNTRGVLGDTLTTAESMPEDAAALFEDGGDVFWMPFAITLGECLRWFVTQLSVSRYPIYDVMQDYLRTSWARYSKHAKHHMTQVCKLLNHETPRPGELYRLTLSNGLDERVTIEATMPGALDFERGLVKVDFQMWPFFQAVDIDHILICVDVALSNSGRIIFCSKHPAMLNLAVNTMKYIVELRGWSGIVQPILHARDTTFVVEDPGPYILGMPTECRFMIPIPSEVVIIDIDSNSLTCKSPPANVVTPKIKRDKAKARVMAAFGPGFPNDRSVPMEFKVSYPKGCFRNFNKMIHGAERPTFLGERLAPPKWWRHAEVFSVFDKIMLDKHKKPTLFQRLTRSGMSRHQAQLTVGEQLTRTMMRRRALHYVETRDDLELKVARINRRLLKLVHEGDHWKTQFEQFERYADKLAQEANDLKVKIDREKREAKRLSAIANEQTKQNSSLEQKLRSTESARAEAMRQLSDMHQSIQELEREREDIMNAFEEQINHALEELPSLGSDGSRPPTPTESALSSPQLRPSSRLRPTTRDSDRSMLSRFTVESRPVSVLGAARAHKIPRPKRATVTNGDGLNEVDRLMAEKGDHIADRIATIQLKLEMALNGTAGHSRSASVATHRSALEQEETEEGGSTPHSVLTVLPENQPTLITESTDTVSDTTSLETPLASRRPSVSPMAVRNDQTPATSPEDLLESVPPTLSGDEYVSADEGTDERHNTTFGPISSGARKVSASELGLIPKGVTLRIKKRHDSASSEDIVIRHDKGLTDSTQGTDELIISPTNSLSSIGSGSSGGIKLRAKPIKGKEATFLEEDKRLSTASVATVTFGEVG